MHVISLIFEGADKDFFIQLLVRNYGFLPLDRNRTAYQKPTGGSIIVFPYPEINNIGGISQFLQPTTYHTCHLRAKKMDFKGPINYPIQHILLRDTDRMAFDDEVSWHEQAQKYHHAFNKSHCDNGVLRVMFCQRSIENWYLAGLSDGHFGAGGILKASKKRELFKLRNVEVLCVDDHLRKYLTDPGLQRTDIAVNIAKDFDIALAKQKSSTFAKYIDILEAFINPVD